MENSPYLVKCEIRDLNNIFRKTLGQVIRLNNKIYSMRRHYERASAKNFKSFRYSRRLQLGVIEGARNMLYNYACIKCDEIENLQEKLREISGEEYNFAQESSNFIMEEGDSLSNDANETAPL